MSYTKLRRMLFSYENAEYGEQHKPCCDVIERHVAFGQLRSVCEICADPEIEAEHAECRQQSYNRQDNLNSSHDKKPP